MPAEDDKREAASAEADGAEREAAPALTGLPRPVQEHLGQQLRTTYQAMAEKPAFLGDENVPAELERHVRRIEKREKIRHQGLEAVRTALQDGEGSESVAPRNTGRREGR